MLAMIGKEDPFAVNPSSTALPLCIALCEGRVSDAIGVKLLLASLKAHATNVPVLAYLSRPLLSHFEADPAALHPKLTLVEYTGPENWSCKPAVLLDALERMPGHRILWVDVDILVAGEVSPLAGVEHETLIVAQESNPNDNARVPLRHAALELAPGAPRETTISSCVIGVTDAHRDLLVRWRTLMEHSAFLAEQALPPGARKLFMGDQEVWEAVLCEPAHASRPIRWLLNDVQMVQADYTTERASVQNVAPGGRMFIHATGNLKPWRDGASRVTQELFPYFRTARPYLGSLSEEERMHFRERSPVAYVWRRLGGGFTSYRVARRELKRFQSWRSARPAVARN